VDGDNRSGNACGRFQMKDSDEYVYALDPAEGALSREKSRCVFMPNK
jgi:hypothetical protein